VETEGRTSKAKEETIREGYVWRRSVERRRPRRKGLGRGACEDGG
jgi:hypothetical protein